MVRQQIGFLMIVVAATIGVIALSAITDTIRQWKTLDKEGKIGGCVMVALLLWATITTAALGMLLKTYWLCTELIILNWSVSVVFIICQSETETSG